MRLVPLSVLLVVLATLAGAGIAAVGLVERAMAVPSFVVPESRHGDHVAYAYERRDDEGTWRPTNWTIAGQIQNRTIMLDHRAAPRHVVDVEVVLRGSNEVRYTEHVALSDRASIGWSADYEGLGLSMLSTLYGASIPWLPGLHLQGRLLTNGTQLDVPVDWPSIDGGFDAQVGVPRPLGPFRVSTPHYVWSGHRPDLQSVTPRTAQATVVQSGLVDGEPAVRLRLTYEARFAPDQYYEEEQDRFVPRPGGTRHVIEHMVVTGTSPYPVEVVQEIEERFDDGRIDGAATRLVKVEEVPGAELVGWLDPVTDPAPTMFDRQRSAAFHPPDGDGATLPYPLGVALADVAIAANDPRWVAWRTQATDTELIGASYTRGTTSWSGTETWEWRLVFFAGSEAYVVRTERAAGVEVAYVEAMGNVTVDAPSSALRGQDVLSIASMIEVWRASVGAAPDAVPDQLRWGAWQGTHRTTTACPFSSTRSPDVPPVDDAVRLAMVGNTSAGPCLISDTVTRHEGIVLRIDGPTLIMRYSDAYNDSRDWQPVTGPARSATEWKRPPVTTAIVFQIPRAEEVAFWGLPLLVTSVFVYFFPAVKYGASQGLLLVGFSKLRRDRLLDHEHRERLHTLVQANPGMTPSALARETGLSWSAVVHHLTVLEQNGLLASRVEGRHRRFFVAVDVPAAEREARALLANPHTHRFYELIVADPGLATSEVAQRLGVTAPGALYHLQRLEASGLVERRREGRTVRCYPRTPHHPYDSRDAVEVT